MKRNLNKFPKWSYVEHKHTDFISGIWVCAHATDLNNFVFAFLI